MHPTSESSRSANFAVTEFYEVRATLEGVMNLRERAVSPQ
jgi:hypothetical protein